MERDGRDESGEGVEISGPRAERRALSVIAASPDDEWGIRGGDLLAAVTLSGDNPDWPLLHRMPDQ